MSKINSKNKNTTAVETIENPSPMGGGQEGATNPSGRKKMKLEPGKKYRGSFWLNEYGVIEVCASEEGTNPTGKKLVTEDKSNNNGGYSIYESKNRIAIHISLVKSQPYNVKRQLSLIMGSVMYKLQDYFFK